jgi:hypothetical protein
MSGRFAQGGVVAMPKTYVRLVKDARYRWLAFVKFCECGFESGRAPALIVATRNARSRRATKRKFGAGRFLEGNFSIARNRSSAPDPAGQ